MKKQFFVAAQLCQNDDGTNFVQLTPDKHTCEPMKFDKEKYRDDIVVNKSDFEILQSEKNVKKLLLFLSPDNLQKCQKLNY